MKKRATVKISKFIILIVVLLFFAIIAKLSYVVLSNKVDGINLQEKAASIATVKKTLYADRGSIYDVNGEELASTINSYTVIAYINSNKTNVTDKEMTAEALSPILNMSKEKLMELLSKDLYQVELRPGGYGISEVIKAKIEKLELPGIDFIKNSKKRYYNKSTFASYLIGYAKTLDDGKISGELGIEGYYDDILSGTNGYTKYLKYTSSNYKIPNTNEDTKKAKNGSDIYLTIDSSIQLIAEKAVSSMKDRFNTDWAVFTVMDAKTGAIVASATSPNFNPNDTNTIKEYMNPLISYQYEPGSVMKVFSFASAIEEGKYNGEETFKSGSYTLDDGTVIRDSERKGWGTISFDEGFARSSNVAATTLALRLGVDTLSEYYNNLGFGKKTGIELSNEAIGDIEMVYQSELATASFGQGVSVTAIQMLQALSAMTNDGTVIKPYIVDKIVDENNLNKGYDAILVLGAGLRNGKPSPILKDRLDMAYKLYENGYSRKIIVSGDHGKKYYDEVNVMKNYLLDKGIESNDIFMDHAGFSTYDSVYRAKEIFLTNNIIIVTQQFHLYRSLYIAEKLELNAVGFSATLRDYSGSVKFELREILARDKDFVKTIFKPEPTYLGDTIPVFGDGNVTND